MRPRLRTTDETGLAHGRPLPCRAERAFNHLLCRCCVELFRHCAARVFAKLFGLGFLLVTLRIRAPVLLPVAILLTVFAVSIAWIIVFDHVLFAAVLAPLFFIAASLLFIPALRDDLGIVLDKARSHPRLAMVLSATHRADD